tara:strand:+ start:1220 stop:1489 length:270 start_codon:yes stop_codon:yes gene_type:complete
MECAAISPRANTPRSNKLIFTSVSEAQQEMDQKAVTVLEHARTLLSVLAQGAHGDMLQSESARILRDWHYVSPSNSPSPTPSVPPSTFK